jgi:hypothetical protein
VTRDAVVDVAVVNGLAIVMVGATGLLLEELVVVVVVVVVAPVIVTKFALTGTCDAWTKSPPVLM